MMYYRHGLRGLGAFDVAACLDSGTDLQTCQGFAATDATAQKTTAAPGSAESNWVIAAKAGGALLPGVLTAFGLGPSPKPGMPVMLAPPTPWYITIPGLAVIGAAAYVGYRLFVK